MKLQTRFKDKAVVGSPVKHYVILSVMLFVFWLLLSGKFETKFIIYGILTALICAFISLPLLMVSNLSGTKKYFLFDVPILKLIKYCLWLCWQLILANIDVMQAYLRPEMRIDPKIIKFRLPLDNPVATTFLANSITLTPGTVTIHVSKDNVFTIHALTTGAADGIASGDMPLHVAKLFGEGDAEFTYLEESEA